MSATELKQAYEDAEAKAQALMAEKDEALQAVRDKYGDDLRQATDEAAEAQKAWLHAEVVESLRDRPDGETVAESLGIDLSE